MLFKLIGIYMLIRIPVEGDGDETRKKLKPGLVDLPE
jgi:hypothetical protein